MTSTRNRNTLIDYKLETKINSQINEHSLYLHSANGRPISECIPSVGYTPSHMSNYALSNNPVDIESNLFGIGSTNLISQNKPVEPSLKNLNFVDYFERNKTVIMPYPMVLNKKERPFPI